MLIVVMLNVSSAKLKYIEFEFLSYIVESYLMKNNH